ncbi:MAG: flagellar motor switch protein FliM [Proteobacteria bacterium]|nr:flagellar motor switch protein FliM [Pseudomonadota bacterium]
MSAEGSEVAKPVISDEEVAALLEKNASGAVKAYDLVGTQRITRGRLPALETIHETFARNFRVALFNLLQREPQVTFEGVRSQKAGDYLAGITTPASLDICRIKPLPGNALMVFDTNLVFLMVDTYFGGPGKAFERGGDRGLTPTEVRFVQLVLRQAASDLAQAWTPVAQVEVELVKHESNPLFASVAAPTDTVLINRFHIDLPAGGGALDLVMPSMMIEPVREVLTAGIVARSSSAEQWGPLLAAHLLEAQVEVRAVLSEIEITLGELTSLKPGDVLPIDAPGAVTLLAGDEALYRGKFGVSRGRNALKILQPLRRRSP